MTYFIQSSICLLAFYTFYYLMLRQYKCFTIQRTYLISSLLLALLIPLVSIQLSAPEVVGMDVVVNATRAITNTIAPVNGAETGYSFLSVVLIIYWIGVGLTALRLFILSRNIYVLIKNGTIKKEGAYNLVFTNSDFHIASFYKYIFIPQTHNFSVREIENIMLHERKHVEDMHTIDLVLVGILKVIFWFNPIIYFVDFELRKVHEYVSDHEVIKHSSLESYERLLINTLFKKANIELFSTFGDLSIKERITKLNNNDPKRFNRWKLIALIPVLLLLIYACSYDESIVQEARVVEGTVIRMNDNRTLPGIRVEASGTDHQTVTDLEGNFKLEVPAGVNSLDFIFMGLKPKRVDLGRETTINVSLENDEKWHSE